jgi:hypothetical protein
VVTAGNPARGAADVVCRRHEAMSIDPAHPPRPVRFRLAFYKEFLLHLEFTTDHTTSCLRPNSPRRVSGAIFEYAG